MIEFEIDIDDLSANVTGEVDAAIPMDIEIGMERSIVDIPVEMSQSRIILFDGSFVREGSPCEWEQEIEAVSGDTAFMYSGPALDELEADWSSDAWFPSDGWFWSEGW